MSDLMKLSAEPVANDNSDSGKKPKRERTKGEVWFDWAVYGGLGWIANSAISLIALDQLEYNRKLKPFVEGSKKLIGGIIKAVPYKTPAAREAAKNEIFFITSIYTGGTVLVGPIKMLEKRKGDIVRWLDNKLYGRDTEQDPELAKAHSDMDHAPQQSWGSLLLARVLALPVGYGIGMLMGRDHALTTKILPEKTLGNYSSFARAGATLARNFSEALRKEHKIFGKTFAPIIKETAEWRSAMSHAREISPHDTKVGVDSRQVRFGANTLYEIALSAMVAFGFYLSSKAFATWRDVFKEQRAEHRAARAPIANSVHPENDESPSNDNALPASNDNTLENAVKPTEKPTTRVGAAHRVQSAENLTLQRS